MYYNIREKKGDKKMNTYYEERENEYFAYLEAMKILEEEAEKEEEKK